MLSREQRTLGACGPTVPLLQSGKVSDRRCAASLRLAARLGKFLGSLTLKIPVIDRRISSGFGKSETYRASEVKDPKCLRSPTISQRLAAYRQVETWCRRVIQIQTTSTHLQPSLHRKSSLVSYPGLLNCDRLAS
jgi:hypothetical protein